MIVLETYGLHGYSIYVQEYDAKTKKLKLTKLLSKAKVYKNKAGAESSARSIYNNWLEGTLQSNIPHQVPACNASEYVTKG